MLHMLIVLLFSSSLLAYSDVSDAGYTDTDTDSTENLGDKPVISDTPSVKNSSEIENQLQSTRDATAAIRDQISSDDDNESIVNDYQTILDAQINKQEAKSLTDKELITLNDIVQKLNAYGQKKTANTYQQEADLLKLFVDRMNDTHDVYLIKALAAQEKSITEINEALADYKINKQKALKEVQEKHPELLSGPAQADNITFLNYLASLDPQFMTISISDALQRAAQGEAFLQSASKPSPENLMDTIANVQWALYKQAIIKEPAGFTSGMIQVKDTDNRLFNLLMQAPHYARPSTHFQGARNESYGVDFDQAILPNGRKTILFGSTKNGTTFMKYEFHGFDTISDKMSHVLDWLATRGKQENGKKEHTPVFINAIYQGLAKKAGINVDSTSLKVNGISYMQNSLPGPYKQEFSTILDLLGLDNSDVRKGNEVILTL